MEIQTRDVPEQHVVIDQRIVDQAALEAWLPGAMAAVAMTATAAGGEYGTDFPAAGAQEPVFVVAFPVAARG